MKINDIDEASLRTYLLGSADEAAAEAIDELSVVNADFAERLGAAERDLIDSHLRGELTTDEDAAFREHYLSSSLRRRRVEFARAFLDRIDREIGEAAPIGLWQRLTAWRPVFPMAAAALSGLILIAIAGFVMFRTGDAERQLAIGNESNSRPDLSVAAPPVATPSLAANSFENVLGDTGPNGGEIRTRNTEDLRPRQSAPQQSPAERPKLAVFIFAPQMRSGGVRSISIPDGSAEAEFRIRIGGEGVGPFTVEIRDSGSRAVWTSGAMTARGQGDSRSVNVRVPASALRNGTYIISISDRSVPKDEAKIADHIFKIVQ